MTDYKVVSNVPSVKAGTIKIGVRNLASMEHNFEVIKTDLAADQLPIDPASAKAIDVGKVGEIVTTNSECTPRSSWSRDDDPGPGEG
jgi:hypothetical protein